MAGRTVRNQKELHPLVWCDDRPFRAHRLDWRTVSTWFLLAVLAGCGGGSGETELATDEELAEPVDSGDVGGDSGMGADDESGMTTAAVDAGLGRIAPAGTAITLDATVVDPTGAASVAWEQIAGPTAMLSDATIEDPILEVPLTGASDMLVFQVTLDNGVDTPLSDTVAVEAWVAAENTALSQVADFSDRSDWGCINDPITTPQLTVDAIGDDIVYSSNGIPAHATGTFPNAGNPNTISEIDVSYTIPANPVKTNTATGMAEFGITLDGVKLERDTGESYQNQRQWNYEAITSALAEGLTGGSELSWLGTDCNNAHVQPTGSYHYHGLPEAMMNERMADAPLDGFDAQGTMVLGGYAADGFPFYLRYGHSDPLDASSELVVLQGSWEVLSGVRPDGPGGAYDGTFRQDWEHVAGSGDLDECNGRFGVTPEYPDGIYHYYLTDDYPFISRCVFGTPDPSFRTRR